MQSSVFIEFGVLKVEGQHFMFLKMAKLLGSHIEGPIFAMKHHRENIPITLNGVVPSRKLQHQQSFVLKQTNSIS